MSAFILSFVYLKIDLGEDLWLKATIRRYHTKSFFPIKGLVGLK